MLDSYNTLKIIHILSGSLVFCTILGVQSYWLWWAYQPLDEHERAPFAHALHQKTLPILILGTLIQIISGFMLISLHHISWQALWIKATFIGIVLLLGNWGIFIGLLSLQRAIARYLAIVSLALSVGILSAMVYFMANQIS